MNAQVSGLGIHASPVCESLLFTGKGVEIRIPLAAALADDV